MSARLALCLRILVGSAGVAQEPKEKAEKESSPETINHAAVFVGFMFDEGDTPFTIGADYERRVNEKIGIECAAPSWCQLRVRIQAALDHCTSSESGPG